MDHFTAAELNDAKHLMRMRKEEQGFKATIKPDKFNPKRWKDWSDQFDVYLSHHKGAQFAPLDYIPVRTKQEQRQRKFRFQFQIMTQQTQTLQTPR